MAEINFPQPQAFIGTRISPEEAKALGLIGDEPQQVAAETKPEPQPEMKPLGMPMGDQSYFADRQAGIETTPAKTVQGEPKGFIGKEPLSSEISPSDIGKSAVSGAYEVKRLPQMAGELIRTGIDEIAYRDFKRQEEAGKIPSADEAYADYKLDQELAYEQSGLKGATEAVTGALPFYGYEPQTRAGAVVKEAVTSGAETVALPFLRPAGALAGAGYGAFSGATGEMARQKFENTPLEPFAQFFGALGGQILGEAAVTGGKQFFRQRGVQEEFSIQLEAALKKDAENGMLKISPQELAEKLKSNEPLSAGEVLKPGSQTTDLLEKLITRTPGAGSENFVGSTLSDISTSKILSGGQLERSLELAADDEAKRVFDILRANPDANDILPAALGKVTQNPYVKKAMERVAFATKDVDQMPGFEIIAPSNLLGKTDTFTYGPAGSVNGGNLNFWHAVKKDIDSLYEKTGDTLLLDIKRDLISGIDNAIGKDTKLYSGALGESAQKYGDLTSMRKGYELMGDINSLKMEDILDLTKNMNPNQLNAFKDGVIARIYEMASEKDGPRKFLNSTLGTDPKVPQKLIEVLGKDEYTKISGAMMQQSILEKAEANKNTGWFKKAMEAGKTIGLAEGNAPKGYSVLSALATGLSAVGGAGAGVTGAAAIVSGLFAGRQYALNRLEKQIAPEAIKLLTDPDGGRKLAELTLKNPNARSFIRKLDEVLLRGSLVGGKEAVMGEAPEPEPLQPLGMPSPNSHGGRIAYKSGGRVKNARSVAEALMREIDQTRKLIGKKTEDILSMPDDAVATALKIARGNV